MSIRIFAKYYHDISRMIQDPVMQERYHSYVKEDSCNIAFGEAVMGFSRMGLFYDVGDEELV